MVMIIKKVFWKLFGKAFNVINIGQYMSCYVKYLKSEGCVIKGKPNYISPDVYFDIQPKASITIEDGVVISKEVMILTHDFSIARGIQAVNGKNWIKDGTPAFYRPVFIGENSFVGARSFLLPGTSIGKNCIIGGGSVVRGIIPDNSIVMGNPAQIVAETDEWTKKQVKKNPELISR